MRTLLEQILDESERFDQEQADYERYLSVQKQADLEIELSELDRMNEAEVCLLYNVDTKAEAAQLIREYYQSIA